MANREHLKKLLEGVEAWNQWRAENPGTRPDLSGANLERANLERADLGDANLRDANLRDANLRDANLRDATLSEADFKRVNLTRANLAGASLSRANLSGANLTDANLERTRYLDTDFTDATLLGVSLGAPALRGAKASQKTVEQSRWSKSAIELWMQWGGTLADDVEFNPTRYKPFPTALIEELDELTYKRYRNQNPDTEIEFTEKDRSRLKEALRKLNEYNRPNAGDVVAQCKLIEVLGKGAFGTVWKAETVDGEHPRAVKIFDSDRLGDSLAVHLFRRGVGAMLHLKEALRRNPLEHDTIVLIQEVEEHKLAFAMDLIPGKDLSHGFIRDKRLEQKLALFRHIAEAVRYGHGFNIVHRDIKPQNIVMNVEEGQEGDKAPLPILTDFDISDMEFAKTLSRRAVGGAFAYAAPEQLSGDCEKLEIRSDIYSLGRMLHFFLLEKDPPPLFEAVPTLRDLKGYPEGLVKIIRRCTFTDVAERYQNVGELLADLANYKNPDEVGAESPGLPEDEAIEKALGFWYKAVGYAEEKSWEAAAKAGTRAVEVIADHDMKRSGDWSRQVLQWRVRAGDPEAAKKLGVPVLAGIPVTWTRIRPLFLFVFIPSLLTYGLAMARVIKIEWFLPKISVEENVTRQVGMLLKEGPKVLEGAVAFLKAKERRPIAERLLGQAFVNGGTPRKSRCNALVGLYRITDGEVGLTLKRHKLYNTDMRTGALVGIDCSHYVALGLSNLQLEGAELMGAKLMGARLFGANLRNANLRNADLSNANLLSADLRNANLRNADLRNANLRNANLRNANLRSAYMGLSQVAVLQEYDLHEKATCLPELSVFTNGAAAPCFLYHQIGLTLRGKRPKNCPRTLQGPIIAYSFEDQAKLKPYQRQALQKGICPWNAKKPATRPTPRR